MKRIYLSYLLILGLAFSQNANLDIFYNSEDNSADIYLQNDAPLSGFQFSLSGVSIESISGGAADEYGFTVVSSSEAFILGFNSSNIQIPEGEHLLTRISINNIKPIKY